MKNVEYGIKLTVAGQEYPVPLPLNKDGIEDERLLREAAKRVEKSRIEYRQQFAKSVGEKDILAMIAIEMARDLVKLEEKNNTITQEIQQLTAKIEDYLQVK